MTAHTRAHSTKTKISYLLLVAIAMFLGGAAAEAADGPTGDKPLPAECSLLDDPKARGKMDGLLYYLARICGREEFLGQVRQSPAVEPGESEGPGIPDVIVNDPSGDTEHGSTTQSETSISRNETTGTYCSGYNDSHSGIGSDNSFTGFSRSTDGGATWSDQGALPSPSSGDPSIVWRESDGKFYFAALRSGGLGIWRSDDDCQTFTFVSQIVSGSDDKEIMAVDNTTPTGTFYGRLYVAWTDFGAGSQIYEVHSDDGGATWSAQVALSGVGVDVQGAWPVVAPNGDVFIGWLRWNPFPSGNIDVEISRSTDGGGTWGLVTNPMTNKVNPRDSGSTATCGRPALNENIRYLPSPQLAVGPDGALHTIYSYDPDAFDVGDAVNVYYRRSTDSGATWGTEIQLNDDATLTDQYFPTLSVGSENIVVATWYDRRNDDPANEMQDTYKSYSPDGGATWVPNIRVSDVSSPIFIDPALASCYHGDYDQNAQDTGFALLQWSDDRRFDVPLGRNDPDVYFELEPVSNDYLLTATPSSRNICVPNDASYLIDVLSFQGFSEDVTLAAVGNPAGSTAAFSTNPVSPPGTSTLTIGTAVATPGLYSIDVEGDSSPSHIMRETQVTLTLSSGIPGSPPLALPADGAINQPKRPTFEWGALPEIATYTIEIATDSAFTNIVDSASGLTVATYTPAADLATNTEHFWRVRASSACGTSLNSAVWSFIVEPAPGDCAFGAVPNEIFFDDLEGGAPGWTHSGVLDSWMLSGARTHSGANAWYSENLDEVSDQLLDSPPIVLPTGESPLTLQFWNWQTIESNAPGCYDGAVLEITTDAGASWTRLESELLTDPYDGIVNNCCDNPIQDENAWCGDPQDWLESIVDLDAYAGQTVQFRFRLATDSTVPREGWYVDDVAVESCPLDAEIFSDGFESGDTSAWSNGSP